MNYPSSVPNSFELLCHHVSYAFLIRLKTKLWQLKDLSMNDGSFVFK